MIKVELVHTTLIQKAVNTDQTKLRHYSAVIRPEALYMYRNIWITCEMISSVPQQENRSSTDERDVEENPKEDNRRQKEKNTSGRKWGMKNCIYRPTNWPRKWEKYVWRFPDMSIEWAATEDLRVDIDELELTTEQLKGRDMNTRIIDTR